jgi:integrase
LRDRDVDPQHGWRHSFKTIALGAGIDERIRDAITGHKVTSVGRKYETPPVSMLAEAMIKFPRYEFG